jgi:integrase
MSDEELLAASASVEPPGAQKDTDMPAHLLEDVDLLREDMLPVLSKNRYLNEYIEFTKWANDNLDGKFSKVTEPLIKAYYAHLKTKYSASSLFSKTSMLKKALYTKHEFPLAAPCWSELTQFTKKAAAVTAPVKAPIFDPSHLRRFIEQEDVTSMHKLAMLLAWYGALRPTELYNMTITNCKLDPQDGTFTFGIDNRKTQANGKKSVWTVPASVTNWSSPVPHYLRVMEARAAYEENPYKPALPNFLFMKMQDGAIRNQRMGENYMGILAKKIADLNELPGNFTGYSFRRSSATALATAGATVHQLTQHLGHKNLGTATEYVDSSSAAQKRVGALLAGEVAPATTESAGVAMSAAGGHSAVFHGCTNVTVNFNVTGPVAALTTSGDA